MFSTLLCLVFIPPLKKNSSKQKHKNFKTQTNTHEKGGIWLMMALKHEVLWDMRI